MTRIEAWPICTELSTADPTDMTRLLQLIMIGPVAFAFPVSTRNPRWDHWLLKAVLPPCIIRSAQGALTVVVPNAEPTETPAITVPINVASLIRIWWFACNVMLPEFGLRILQRMRMS